MRHEFRGASRAGAMAGVAPMTAMTAGEQQTRTAGERIDGIRTQRTFLQNARPCANRARFARL